MALTNVIANIILDLYDHDLTPSTIKTIALDSASRYVSAVIRDRGGIYDIGQNTAVTLTVVRPDKTGVQITGEPIAHEEVTPDEQIITTYGAYAELTPAALAIKGNLRAQFMLTSGDQVLRTEIFTINNGEALDSGDGPWAGDLDGHNLDEMAQSIEDLSSDVAEIQEDVTDLKEGLSAMNIATSADVGKALKAKTVTDGKVTEWEFGSTGSGSGLTQSQKLAILNCFAHVAWTDAQGQTYYDELEDVLFPPAELTSISATYVNSNPVYTDTDIETLKQYITVTAHYSDGTTSAVNAYTLSGTLTLGTSVLTVAYSEMTTTISVTVSATPKSDMDGWADGVMYTDIEVIENSYYNGDGNPQNYNNWDRTGKIPCDGASTLLFKANVSAPIDKTYCWFFAQDESPLQKFDTSPLGDSDVSINVPSTAYYFGISSTRSQIAAQLTQGIYPYA